MMPRTFVALLIPLLQLALNGQSTDQTAPAPHQAKWPSPVEDNRVLTYWIFNQLEGRTNNNGASFRWDGEGWIGNDFNKLWIGHTFVSQRQQT